MSNFYTFEHVEVVSSGNKTKHQVGEFFLGCRDNNTGTAGLIYSFK